MLAVGRVVILTGLFGAFYLLFLWMIRERAVETVLRKAASSVDLSVRNRAAERRRSLAGDRRSAGRLNGLERRLRYSGLALRFPFLTPEVWIVGNLVCSGAAFFVFQALFGDWRAGAAAAGSWLGAVRLLVNAGMRKNYEAVDADLLKFLDFLGNYSVTAGEVTGIFSQIARYMEEPLRTALNECYYEAQTSGNAGLALLALAERIEHPRFKELIRSIEISARYSADFKVLVGGSRRAVREHLRTRQERKALLREAFVNMAMLLGMSALVLLAAGRLVGADMKGIMLGTAPGKVCLAVIALVLGLFYRQAGKLDG